jgi:hypothetical protein
MKYGRNVVNKKFEFDLSRRASQNLPNSEVAAIPLSFREERRRNPDKEELSSNDLQCC